MDSNELLKETELDFERAYINFQKWIEELGGELIKKGVAAKDIEDIINISKFVPNKFSESERKRALKQRINMVVQKKETLVPKVNQESGFTKEAAIKIIRTMLKNFYLYIQSMYQRPVHGRGTIAEDDLERIKIGNEYDVQRMLVSILQTVFPDARVEVFDDGGYTGVRYDIVISHLDIVIETKCTRESMTERGLTEEIGADAYHYPVDTLFIFIYDKANLIKNVKAFEEAYTREGDEYEKKLETIIIQPIKLI